MLQLFWLLPLATLFQEMSALVKKEKKKKKKKRKKIIIYEEIKRSKYSEPRKKRKSEMRGKNGKCPTVELGVQDTHLREKKNIEHLIKFQKARKVCIPSKEQK